MYKFQQNFPKQRRQSCEVKAGYENVFIEPSVPKARVPNYTLILRTIS